MMPSGAVAVAKHGVALLGGGPRHVLARLRAAEQHQKGLPGGQSVERQAGAYEGHRAEIAGDIDRMIREDSTVLSLTKIHFLLSFIISIAKRHQQIV